MPAKNKTKRWSVKEELDLEINCTNMSVRELSKKLKRSYGSVNWKLTQLHLNKKAREMDMEQPKTVETPTRKSWFERLRQSLRG